MTLLILGFLSKPVLAFQLEFEFVNNFLQNLSFITGTDRGKEQNLEDNMTWLQQQGYTHLRFFGIYPNGYHAFPSATLDANGFPTNAAFETTLELLIDAATGHGITVNFDGWEVIAESNRDTTALGVGYITEAELAAVIEDVVSLGVTLITEEQFGGSYLQTIHSTCSGLGATHETTSWAWWQYPMIADEQLASVFNFYVYDQGDLDTLAGPYPPSNLGNFHHITESARYFGYPHNIAVGSFGSLETENWKNVLRFAQIQHSPQRVSIEETNTDMLIWAPSFNFMDYIGTELLQLGDSAYENRPIANVIYDFGTVYSGTYSPVGMTSMINGPAIVNLCTLLGYRVVGTIDSVLPEADIYYLQLVGGANETEIVPLPDYVLPLLASEKPVIVHPSFGIPDETDATDWLDVRELFGLPGGETDTYVNAIPNEVIFDGHAVLWEGVSIWNSPLIEGIQPAMVDTDVASVVLEGEYGGYDFALVIRNGNRFLINSNVIHLQASFILSQLLGGPLNLPATADIAVLDNSAIIFAEYDTEIDLNIPWGGTTRVIRFDANGDLAYETDVDLAGSYYETLARGELVVLSDIYEDCCGIYTAGITGNANCSDDGKLTLSDISRLIDYLYISKADLCCYAAGNTNGSWDDGECKVTLSDISRLIDVLYISKLPPAGCMPECER